MHNVAIEKDTANISKADLLTTSAPENDCIFIATILQNALVVKYRNKTAQKELADLNGKKAKDDTIYDFEDDAEELLFTSDGDISFEGYGTDAAEVKAYLCGFCLYPHA